MVYGLADRHHQLAVVIARLVSLDRTISLRDALLTARIYVS